MRTKFLKGELRTSIQDTNQHVQIMHAAQYQTNRHTLSYEQNNPPPAPIPIIDSRVRQGPPISSERLNNLQSRSTSSAALSEMSQLRERLKNLHHFYKMRIDQQKSRTAQRNEVFLVMVEEMQRNHAQKVAELRNLIQQAQAGKRDVGLVDQHMTDIKGSIDDILKRSSDLKDGNEQLQRQIKERKQVIRQKQQELGRVNEELLQVRSDLQSFERLNLRENKRNKQIEMMIQKISEGI